MLVVPVVPKGTPAVITTRLPAGAKPSAWAVWVARLTMSAKLCTSRVTTEWAPQTTAMRRATSRLAVSDTTGTSGRARATRRVVEPEEVKVTTAAACRVSATWRAALEMASRTEFSGGSRLASRNRR